MNGDSLLARNAVWDLILREALEVKDEAEVRADLLLNLLQLLRQLVIVLRELHGTDKHPSSFDGCLANGLDWLVLCVLDVDLPNEARVIHLDVAFFQGAPVLLCNHLVGLGFKDYSVG